MKFKRSISLIVMLIFLLCIITPVFAAIEINETFIEMVFSKIQQLDERTKTEAFGFMKSYFKAPNTLEALKDDIPFILKIVIGDEYKTKLSRHGFKKSDIDFEIDRLKSWSEKDRMKLIELTEKMDKEGVKDLWQKYETSKDDKPSTSGGSRESSTGKSSTSKDSTTLVTPVKPPQTQLQESFKDIQNHWAKNYIEKIAQKEIIKGRAPGIFAPNENVTRAEFVTMLCRLLDLKQVEDKELSFNDVNEKDWFYNTVKTAYHSGLVKGKGENFDPNGLITRQELVAFVNRAASLKDKSTSLEEKEIKDILAGFSDKETISSWAKAEIAAAIKLGLANGISEDIFAPKGNATRAQAATAIYNLCSVLEN